MAYLQGQLIRLFASFSLDGALTDPTTVTVKYKTPTGTSTTLVYPTDFAVVKDGVGNYHLDLNLNAGGTWYFRWEATGTIIGAAQETFTVAAASV